MIQKIKFLGTFQSSSTIADRFRRVRISIEEDLPENPHNFRVIHGVFDVFR